MQSAKNVQNSFIQQVEHIAGKHNVSDLFTKEDKESTQFMAILDALQATPPTTKILN